MCIKALDERGLDDFELADKRAACVNFDLRMLMRDLSPCCGAPCRVEGRTTLYYVCATCGKPCDPRPDTSACCGAAIERRYYRWPGVPCKPDDADYSEQLCVECGRKVEEK